MGFTGIVSLAEAPTWQSFFFKTSSPSGAAGRWYDAAVGAGIPVYQAYVGQQYEATLLIGESNRGIYTGPTPSAGQTKHLFALSAGTSTASVPLTMLLADYLMFYPLIDMDSLDPQDMINPVSISRYTSGEGVQAYLVVAAPMSSSGTVTVTYTNSQGTANRTSTFGIASTGTIGQTTSTQPWTQEQHHHSSRSTTETKVSEASKESPATPAWAVSATSFWSNRLQLM
jgi:hypothetical protein